MLHRLECRNLFVVPGTCVESSSCPDLLVIPRRNKVRIYQLAEGGATPPSGATDLADVRTAAEVGPAEGTASVCNSRCRGVGRSLYSDLKIRQTSNVNAILLVPAERPVTGMLLHTHPEN